MVNRGTLTLYNRTAPNIKQTEPKRKYRLGTVSNNYWGEREGEDEGGVRKVGGGKPASRRPK